MAYAGGGAAAAELGPELVVVHATFPFSSLSPPPTPSPEHVPSSRYETACKNSSCINSIVETPLILSPSYKNHFISYYFLLFQTSTWDWLAKLHTVPPTHFRPELLPVQKETPMHKAASNQLGDIDDMVFEDDIEVDPDFDDFILQYVTATSPQPTS